MPVLHFRTLRDGQTFGKGLFAFEGSSDAPIQITQGDLTQFDYQDPIVGQLSLKEVATFYFVVASTENNCAFNLNIAAAEKSHALVAGTAQPHHLGAVSVPNSCLQLEWPTTEQGQAISPQPFVPKAKILTAPEVAPAPQPTPAIAAQTEPEGIKTEIAPSAPSVEIKTEAQAELPAVEPAKPAKPAPQPAVSKPTKGSKATSAKTPAAKATKKNSKTPAPAKTKAVPAVAPQTTAKVIISNIHYKGKVKRTQADEYIEIKNVSSEIINISGWKVSAGHEGQNFVFPENTTLQIEQSVRVYTNEIHPETGGFSFGIGRAIWNDEGDIGSLYDQSGVLIDKKGYGKFA